MSLSSLTDFEMGKILGKGAFGMVCLVKRKFDGKTYAMKRIKIAEIVESKDGERLLERTKGEIFFLNQLNSLETLYFLIIN